MSTKKYDVVLLTEPRYENPPEPDWYDLQILKEDGFVREALERRGLQVHRTSWDNPNFDWTTTWLAVFRTTWDYFNRFEEFKNWLDRTAQQTRFLNPVELVRWNFHKSYLLDLQKLGVKIAPTRLVRLGENWDLKNSFEEWKTDEIIIKPCIAGTARETYRIGKNEVEAHQKIFNRLLETEDMLVQPFLKNVLAEGEVSALMFGGKFSHAVLKRAKTGDFRVQDDFGGKVFAHEILPDELALAQAAAAACSPQPAYARVDMMRDFDGQPVISELEMVEPELFFRFRPEAAELLAAEIFSNL